MRYELHFTTTNGKDSIQDARSVAVVAVNPDTKKYVCLFINEHSNTTKAVLTHIAFLGMVNDETVDKYVYDAGEVDFFNLMRLVNNNCKALNDEGYENVKTLFDALPNKNAAK